MFPIRLVLRSTIVLAGALLLGVPAASAMPSPQPDPVFVAEPAEGSSTEPGGGYFVLDAVGGQTITQSLALRNDSDHVVELRLAAVDAFTAQTGGSTFGLDDTKPTDTGTWLTLDRGRVTLPAGASLAVPFRVRVPDDAGSGVHLAGISVLAPTPDDSEGGALDEGAGASVTVQSRRVVAVQINLPGPAEPELVITGVIAVARPDALFLEIAVVNQGRGLTHGEGELTLSDNDFAQAFSVGTFVPGTSIAYPIRWTERATEGAYPTHVEIRYDNRVAVWDGIVSVGDAVSGDQENRQIVPSTPAAPAPGGGTPVLGALGAVVLLVLAMAVGILLGRRSRKDESGPVRA